MNENNNNSDNEELTCLNGHPLIEIAAGHGTKNKKTRCTNCKRSGKNNFLSCSECKYDLCIECQGKTKTRNSSRKQSKKDFIECQHEKSMFTFSKEELEQGECNKELCENSSEGYFICTCSIKLCTECYISKFPEDKEKYVLNNKNSNNKINQNDESKELSSKDVSSKTESPKEGITKEEFLTKEEHSKEKNSNLTMSKLVLAPIPKKDAIISPCQNEPLESLTTRQQDETVDTSMPNEKDPTKCKKWHELEKVSNVEKSRFCNKCATGGNTDFYYCYTCDYIHCLPCYEGQVKQEYKCCIIM